MPIYEYECDSCHERFERRQKVSDEPIKVCPTCGGETRRLIFPVGIIFKGSGFYCTDNRGGNVSSPKSSGKSGDTEKAATGSADASSEKKAEEPKSEAKKSESKPADKETVSNPV